MSLSCELFEDGYFTFSSLERKNTVRFISNYMEFLFLLIKSQFIDRKCGEFLFPGVQYESDAIHILIQDGCFFSDIWVLNEMKYLQSRNFYFGDIWDELTIFSEKKTLFSNVGSI